MSHRFTLPEAESLLPDVSKLMHEAVELKAKCQEAEESIEALSQKVMMYGGMIVDRDRARAVRTRRDETLERLNEAWGTRFWSQTYDDWDQIDLPHPTPTWLNPTVLLDETRFISDCVVRFGRSMNLRNSRSLLQ